MTLRHTLPPFFNLPPEQRAPWSKIFILPNNRKNFIYCQNILNCTEIVLCHVKYLFFGVKRMQKLLVFRTFRRGVVKTSKLSENSAAAGSWFIHPPTQKSITPNPLQTTPSPLQTYLHFPQ